MATTRRWKMLGGVAVLILLVSADRAGAQSASGTVTIDEEAQLVKAVDGTSTLTAVLTVSGVPGPTVVSIDVADHDEGTCVPYSLPVVRTGVSTKVSIKLPVTCEVSDAQTLEFTTYPLGSVVSTPSGTTIVAETTTEDPSPAYVKLLWGFGIGATLAIAFTLIAWWLGPDGKGKGTSWKLPDSSWGKGMFNPLPGLDTKWSWSDSQLSNMTVAAGVFTGLLGSTGVLEKILGDNGDGPVAVVVVAAALSTALVAAAPLILGIARKEEDTYVSSDAPNNYIVIGVLAATAMVGAASLGSILTIALTMWDGSGIDRGWIGVGAGAAALLVIAHGSTSMRRTIKIGLLVPKPAPESPRRTGGSDTPPQPESPGDADVEARSAKQMRDDYKASAMP